MAAAAFFERGWIRFEQDPGASAWAAAARPWVERFLADPASERRCGGTWLPGVNVFPNEADGGAPALGVAPLNGRAVDFIDETLRLSGFAWDHAQISLCLPGYPRHGAEETEAAFRFRRDRDAAHVDGLLREPPARNRRLGETHGFILGIPIFGVEDPGASPMVVWEGSHEIMRAAFRDAFADVAPEKWSEQDVTEAYQAARRRCFEDCPRVAVAAPVGGAYIVHRLALHGVAPWAASAEAGPRAVAYLRPDPLPGEPPAWWLDAP